MLHNRTALFMPNLHELQDGLRPCQHSSNRGAMGRPCPGSCRCVGQPELDMDAGMQQGKADALPPLRRQLDF
eukprot:2239786-Alexandrium_andersonii.AAC.1